MRLAVYDHGRQTLSFKYDQDALPARRQRPLIREHARIMTSRSFGAGGKLSTTAAPLSIFIDVEAAAVDFWRRGGQFSASIVARLVRPSAALCSLCFQVSYCCQDLAAAYAPGRRPACAFVPAKGVDVAQ